MLHNMNKETTIAIESELKYQKDTAAKWDHKDNPSVECELLLLQEYVKDAISAWRTTSVKDETKTLDIVRKIVGIGVRCMNNNGAIPRE